MQTQHNTNKQARPEQEITSDLKCSFCGKPKAETYLLVQGLDKSCICDKCIKRANKIYNDEILRNDIETDKPILKTAHTIAGNREITINVFEHQYTITIRRYSQNNNDEGIYETQQTINLTEPSLGLLIRLLNNTATEFNINIDGIIKQLIGNANILETFHQF